jgi:hypothetical protein
LARLSQSAAAEFRSLDQEIRSVVPDCIITPARVANWIETTGDMGSDPNLTLKWLLGLDSHMLARRGKPPPRGLI